MQSDTMFNVQARDKNNTNLSGHINCKVDSSAKDTMFNVTMQYFNTMKK